MKLGTVSTSHLKQSGNSGNVEHLLDHVPEGGQFIASPEILPRMDSGGILDVATAAGLYLTSSSEVLPPDQYPPEEILSAQDLTEEDRKLAAALVAVQLVQQQKQQQLLLNEATVNTAANTTQNIISHEKLIINQSYTPEPLLLDDDSNKPADSDIQHFDFLDSRIPHVKLTTGVTSNNLPFLNTNTRRTSYGYRTKTTKRIGNKTNIQVARASKNSLLPLTSLATSNSTKEIDDESVVIKTEVDELLDLSDDFDSDFNDLIRIQSSRKSLPHKKRISRKLKTNSTPPKNTTANKSSTLVTKKCSKCKDGKCNGNHEDFHKENIIVMTSPVLNQKSPGLTFSCQLCTQIYDSQLLFFEHLKSHYEPPAALPSTAPPEKKKPNVEPISTDNTPKKSTSMKCLECGKYFRRQQNFDSHMRVVHPKPAKIDVDEFSEPEDLMEGIHVVVSNDGCVTSESPPLLPNGQSNLDPMDNIVSIRSNTELLTNTNIIVNDTKVWYREDELHATEADLQELEAQQLKEQQMQQNTLTSFICYVCGAIFTSKAFLQQHTSECYQTLKPETVGIKEDVEKVDEEEDEGVVKKGRKKGKGHMPCNICGRIFNHRNSLVYHMRSHSGDRPHQCEQCGKSFFTKSALKVHMRLHSGDKPYKCEFCERHFRQWGDLKYHCISIHSNERQYQCEYCGKDFARKYSLIVHRRIHTGEKNYQCEYCNKTFRASSYLQNHRKIHTGEKPHPCEICGKPFRVRSDMRRHMNTHNKYNKDKNVKNIKTNVSSDSDEAEHAIEELKIAEASVTKENETPSGSLIPKTETVNIKGDSSQEMEMQTPKEEDVLYTVPSDPLTIREGNNTVYVWPVYMS